MAAPSLTGGSHEENSEALNGRKNGQECLRCDESIETGPRHAFTCFRCHGNTCLPCSGGVGRLGRRPDFKDFLTKTLEDEDFQQLPYVCITCQAKATGRVAKADNPPSGHESALFHQIILAGRASEEVVKAAFPLSYTQTNLTALSVLDQVYVMMDAYEADGDSQVLAVGAKLAALRQAYGGDATVQLPIHLDMPADQVAAFTSRLLRSRQADNRDDNQLPPLPPANDGSLFGSAVEELLDEPVAVFDEERPAPDVEAKEDEVLFLSEEIARLDNRRNNVLNELEPTRVSPAAESEHLAADATIRPNPQAQRNAEIAAAVKDNFGFADNGTHTQNVRSRAQSAPRPAEEGRWRRGLTFMSPRPASVQARRSPPPSQEIPPRFERDFQGRHTEGTTAGASGAPGRPAAAQASSGIRQSNNPLDGMHGNQHSSSHRPVHFRDTQPTAAAGLSGAQANPKYEATFNVNDLATLVQTIVRSERSDFNSHHRFGSHLPKLPPQALPNFSGDGAYFPGWQLEWTERIDSNPSLSDSEKMGYLVKCLGEIPLRKISHLAVIGASYTSAMDRLYDCYGDSGALIGHVEAKIRNLQQLTRDSTIGQINRFLEDLSQLQTILSQAHVEPGRMGANAPVVWQKLSDNLRRFILERTGAKSVTFIAMHDILLHGEEFVRLERNVRGLSDEKSFAARNDGKLEGGKKEWKKKVDKTSTFMAQWTEKGKQTSPFKPKASNFPKTTQQFAAKGSRPPVRCVLCCSGGSTFHHEPWYCHNFPNYKARVARARELKLCHQCLENGHWAAKCPKEPYCHFCKKKESHCSTLCEKGLAEGMGTWRLGYDQEGRRIPSSRSRPVTGLAHVHVGPTEDKVSAGKDTDDEGNKTEGVVTGLPQMAAGLTGAEVHMPTMDAVLCHPNDKELAEPGFVYLDLGGSHSCIRKDVADRLQLPVLERNVSHDVLTFSNTQPVKIVGDVVRLNLSTAGGSMELNCWAIPDVCPAYRKDRTDMPKAVRQLLLSRFPDLLNPPTLHSTTHQVSVLIGLDYGAAILQNPSNRTDYVGGTLVTQTKFGSFLLGVSQYEGFRVSHNRQRLVSNLMMRSTTDDLAKLYSIESHGITHEELNVGDEERAETQFKDHFSRLPDGRMEVGILLRDWPPTISNNQYFVCVKRLENFVRSLNPDGGDYTRVRAFEKQIEEWLEDGVIEEVTAEGGPAGATLYNPVFSVQHPQTRKSRAVVDSSMSSSKHRSLNDRCLNTPNLLANILDIAIRFELPPFVGFADIKGAYLQCALKKSHRDLGRFPMWKNASKPMTPENIRHMRFKRMWFGLASAPYTLNAAIQELLLAASEEPHYTCDNILYALRNSYVDNIQFRGDSALLLIKYARELRKVFATAKMELVKFCANTPVLRAAVPEEWMDKDTDDVRWLGHIYHPSDDTWEIAHIPSLSSMQGISTLRQLLSNAAKIWDIRRLLAPLTMPLLLAAGESHRRKLTFDEKLPEDILRMIGDAVLQIDQARSQRIPRRIILSETHPIRMVGFCDASRVGFGFSIGLVQEVEGKVSRRFVIGGASPLPTDHLALTAHLPKSELLAAQKLAMKMKMVFEIVRKEVDIVSFTAFGDNTTVLAWLYTSKTLPNQFVRNRVKVIAGLIKELGIEFRFVPTDENVADIATRPPTWESFQNSSWFAQNWGPSWLSLPYNEWPNTLGPNQGPGGQYEEHNEVAKRVSDGLREEGLDEFDRDYLRSPAPFLLAKKLRQDAKAPVPQLGPYSIDANKYSSMKKLLRVTVMTKRAVERMRRVDLTPPDRPITGQEMAEARKSWVVHVQGQAFPETIAKLKKNERDKLTQKYELFLYGEWGNEEDDWAEPAIIRCGSRLQNSPLPLEAVHPALLPQRGSFTALAILEAHQLCGHLKVRLTLARLLRRYKIAGGSFDVVSMALKGCVECRRDLAGSYLPPVFAPYPGSRYELGIAFKHMSLDMVGPLNIFVDGNRESTTKVYLLTVVCNAVGALAAYVMMGGSAHEVQLAIRRHFSVHGVCKSILMDNAPNLLQATRLLTQHLGKKDNRPNQVDLSETLHCLAEHEVAIRTSAPFAPWMNGKVERQHRTLKQIMRAKGSRKEILTLSELQVRVAEAVATINNTPIMHIGDFPADGLVLTRAHFLNGQSVRCALPESSRDMYQMAEGPDPPNKSDRDLATIGLALQKLAKEDWRNLSKAGFEDIHSARLRFSGSSRGQVTAEPMEGDICLIKDKGVPRNVWPMCRVLEVMPNDDGQIRNCRVLIARKGRAGAATQTRVARRATKNLFPLTMVPRPHPTGRLPREELFLERNEDVPEREEADLPAPPTRRHPGDPNLEASDDEDEEEEDVQRQRPVHPQLFAQLADAKEKGEYDEVDINDEPAVYFLKSGKFDEVQSFSSNPIRKAKQDMALWAYQLQDEKRELEEAQAEKELEGMEEMDMENVRGESAAVKGCLGLLPAKQPSSYLFFALCMILALPGVAGQAATDTAILHPQLLPSTAGHSDYAYYNKNYVMQKEDSEVQIFSAPFEPGEERKSTKVVRGVKKGLGDREAAVSEAERLQLHDILVSNAASRQTRALTDEKFNGTNPDPYLDLSKLERRKEQQPHPKPHHHQWQSCPRPSHGAGIPIALPLQRAPCLQPQPTGQWIPAEYELFVPQLNLPKTAAWKCVVEITEIVTHVSFVGGKSVLLHQVTEHGMEPSLCRAVVNSKVFNGMPLNKVNEGTFSTSNLLTPVWSWCCYDLAQTSVNAIIMQGEVAVTHNGRILSNLASTGGCRVEEGNCTAADWTVVWDDVSLRHYCPYVSKGIFAGTKSGAKVVLPGSQSSFVIVGDANEYFQRKGILNQLRNGTELPCVPTGAVITAEGPVLLPKRIGKETNAKGGLFERAAPLGTATFADALKLHDFLAGNTDAENQHMQYLVFTLDHILATQFAASRYEMCILTERLFDLSLNLLAVDATRGVRALLGRQNIAGTLVGDVVLVTDCVNVDVSDYYLDYRLPGNSDVCYVLMPVKLTNGKIMFALPHSRDLVDSSPQHATCLGLPPAALFSENDYRVGERNWLSLKGQSPLHSLTSLRSSDASDLANITFKGAVMWDTRSVPTGFSFMAYSDRVHMLEAKLESLVNYSAGLSLDPNAVIGAIQRDALQPFLSAAGQAGQGWRSFVQNTGASAFTAFGSALLNPWINILYKVLGVLVAVGLVALFGYFYVTNPAFRSCVNWLCCCCCQQRHRRRQGRGDRDLEMRGEEMTAFAIVRNRAEALGGARMMHRMKSLTGRSAPGLPPVTYCAGRDDATLDPGQVDIDYPASV